MADQNADEDDLIAARMVNGLVYGPRLLGVTAWAKLRVQLDGLIHHSEDQILFLDLGLWRGGRGSR